MLDTCLVVQFTSPDHNTERDCTVYFVLGRSWVVVSTDKSTKTKPRTHTALVTHPLLVLIFTIIVVIATRTKMTFLAKMMDYHL